MTQQSLDRRLLGFITELSRHTVDDERIADVAEALAASGARLTDRGPFSAGFASTGGPTSLSTLLVPLFMRAAGLLVPTLAVPGRPAGGVDVLATLPSYRTELGANEVERVLMQVGHAHFAAGGAWAPDDAELFLLRQRIGAQACPALVIASLLAKKLAVGVQRVGLDVRVAPHGNFGATVHDAELNARRFARVARIVGLSARAILTDGTRPYQPYVGRGEALVAISDVLTGNATGSLAAHGELCRRMAFATARRNGAIGPLFVGDASEALFANLGAQGSGPDELHARVAAVRGSARTTVVAPHDGFVRFRLDLLRDALVAHQRDTALVDGAGVVLCQEPGAPVVRGDTLVAVRCDGPADACAKLRLAIATVAMVVSEGAPSSFEALVVDDSLCVRPL